MLNAFAVTWVAAADAPATVERTIFAGSIKPVANANATTSASTADPSESMEFMISLKMRNSAELAARIARGALVARAEMESRYFPLETDYLKVVDWLKAQGFTITKTDPARLGVFARGTVAQLNTSLQVDFARRESNGKSYPSATTAPSLPVNIAIPVLSINGLQPDIQLRRHSRRIESGVTTQINNAPPFYPREILKAYNGDTLTADGSGQKIGVVIDTFPNDSDLTSFWSQAGVSQSLSNIEKVQVVSGTLPAPSGEETLDVEWASGIAPAAKVRVYASLDLSFVHVDQVFQQIVADLPSQPALKQISISLGLGETFVGAGQLQTDAQYFAAMAAAGVTVFVSSGDSGSNEGGMLQVSYFASDVSVTGVGGTSLSLNSSTGAMSSETVWTGSGGGISANFNRPSWQVGTGVAAGTKRLVPDVAAVANPSTGGFVILYGAIYQYGGTSWSAPIWAGISARINQGRAAAAMSSLGSLGPKIYPLLGTPAFRDITSGSNGAYSATAGHDMCTGLGVPHMANLFTALTTTLTQPNLIPAPLPGWSDAIVISKATNTNTDDLLTPADTLYMDFAVMNTGGVPVDSSFVTEIYVDNVLRTSFTHLPVVGVNGGSAFTDYSLGKLPLGTHTIRIKVDAANAIAELSEADNEYTKTITVTPPVLFDSVASAALTSTGGVPRSFMGDPITLTASAGTANIPVVGGVAYLRAATSTNYTNIRLNITFWGAASGATLDSTPAFSNSLGSYSFDLGPLNATAFTIYPYTFTLPSPVVFPNQAGGITINWQGNTGGGLASTDNLTSVIRYGATPVVVGAFTAGTAGIFGYYRNASGETDGNFRGDSFRTLGDINGTYPNQGLALQLYGPSDLPPAITIQPSNVTAGVGGNATFSVAATGIPAPTYQWQRKPSGGSSFTNLTEGNGYFFVTTANLSVTASSLTMSGDQFRCVASNASGNATSNAATLTVLNLPVITQQPVDVAVTAGQPATLSVTATGSGPLTYQWRRNGLPIPGATTASLALNPAHVADNGSYNVLISLAGLETLSNPATLTVAPTRYPGAMYVDPTFAPLIEELGGTVYALVAQPDGKLLVAGERMRINGSPLRSIARLNVDGSVDTSFDPGTGPDNVVQALLLQPDGKIVIGGEFLRVDGINRGRIARLNANGSVDFSFDTSVGADYTVYALARAADGSIQVAGGFTSVNGVARTRLARLSATGAVLPSFDPGVGPNSDVRALAFQSDGKLIICGGFSTYGGVSRARVARVNTNGSLDTSFTRVGAPDGSDAVYAVALQPDGKIIVGGLAVDPAYRLRRLNTDGSVDGTFNVGGGPSSTVNSLLLQSDGKILVGGLFAVFNGFYRPCLVRLNSDGSLDSFAPATSDLNGIAYALAVTADGKVALGGQLYDGGSGARVTSLRRFTSTGARDAGFAVETRTPGAVNEMIQQPDGKLLLAGRFNYVNGVGRNHAARLLANGALDTTFNPGSGFDSSVNSMVLQPDGKVVFAGYFYLYNGTFRSRIVRTNADGSLDGNFNPGSGPDYGITALAQQADGKFLIGGAFTNVGGTTRNHLARLNTNGSLDTTFNPGSGPDNWPLSDLTLQPDGRVLFAGWFGSYNGVSRSGLARILPDGALDTSFNPASAQYGFSLLLQPDGKVVYASTNPLARYLANGTTDSTFSAPAAFGGVTLRPTWGAVRPRETDTTTATGTVAPIYPELAGDLKPAFVAGVGLVGTMFRQPDGKILLGQEINSGMSPIPVGIARVTANGALDSSFSAGGIRDAKITRFIMLDDGQLLAAGEFFNDGVVQQGGLVRLTYMVAPAITTPPVAQSVVVGGNATFTVAGSGGGLQYQWLFNGSPINGATGAKLVLTNLTTANAGQYSVTLTNAITSITSGGVTLTVVVPPAIVSHPLSRAVGAGGLHTFNVAATGTPLGYQWRKNGTAIPGATGSELSFAAVKPSDGGSYDVVVANIGGSATSNTAVLTVLPNPGAFSSRQLISTAGAVSYFALEGAQTKHLLLRAVGPTLATFGVQGALADPQITVLDASGSVVASNDNWGSVTGVDLSAIFAQVGAFPLPSGSADAALYATLPPGSYQVKISGVGGTTGHALLELYDTDTNSTTRIAYLGLRGRMDSDNNGLSAGLTIRNSASKRMLIRAIGPTLGDASALPDPQLQIYDGGTTIASNDNWGNAASLITAASQAGAFALPANSVDAAVLIDQRVGTGVYNATIPYAGAGLDALLEIYDVNAAGVPTYAPLIVVPPVSTSVTVGNSVALRAFAVGGGTLAYQWRKNGANILGATSSTLNFASPLVADTGSYDVTVNSSFGHAVSSVATLVVNPVAPVIVSTPPLAQTAVVGSPFVFGPITMNARSAPVTFTMSVSAGLTGLSVDSLSGNISGTPSGNPGSYSLVLTATNSIGTDSKTIALTLNPAAPVITSPASVSVQAGSPISYTLTATPATGVTFAATNLPAWLSFNATTGALTGTPNTVGTVTVQLTAANTTGTATLPLVVSVTANPSAPVYSGPLNPTGTAGTAFTFTPNFGPGTTTYALSGTIPSGLVINSSTGVLSWPTPLVGTWPVTVSATRSGVTVSAELVITINPAPTAPIITSASTGMGTAGQSFTFNLTSSPAATSYAGIDAGGTIALNASGLSINPTTGVITGTLPKAPGTVKLSVNGTNAAGTGASSLLVITVNHDAFAPVITSPVVIAGQVGVPLTYTLTSTAGVGGATATGVTYGFTGALPPGLSSSGGTITGTPTAAGSYENIFVAGTNSNGFTGLAVELIFTLAPPANVPVVNSNGTASGQVGQQFNYAITATNSPTSFTAAGLPANGLSVNADGVISGIPSAATASGSPMNITLMATNGAGTSAPKTLLITIAPAPATPVITSAASATGRVGTAFTYNITASGSPTSFVATGLPAGLTLNSATGAIGGTPTVAGTFAVALRAANAAGLGAESPLAVTIASAAGAPAITSAAATTGQVGVAFSYQTVATPGPITSYGASLADIQKLNAAGLRLNSGTGLINGTPTAPGVLAIALTATNSAGSSSPQPLTITISPGAGVPVITSPNAATGTVGGNFTYAITATNAPLITLDAVNLPPGLSVNPTTGLIQGVPTTVGLTAASLVATNAFGTGPAADLAITVLPAIGAPLVTSANLASAQVGAGFAYQITATNTPISFEVPGAPAWMTINAATGALAGTPTAPGTITVQLIASNGAGASSPRTLTISVAGATGTPAITSTRTVSGVLGTALPSFQITATPAATSYFATGLPPGLTINPATGTISGTPTMAGTFSATVSASNSSGAGTPVTVVFTITSPVTFGL